MGPLEKAIFISAMSVYVKKVTNSANNREIKRGAIFLYQSYKTSLKGQINIEEIEQLDKRMCSATSSWEYCPIIDRTTKLL
ncbi:hypothetical protein KAT80_03330 [Candidatus Pacearchaeota archaeon]|nr:hypothetical protein [Candidatus Pacearchaeota archaeon]